MKKLPISVKSLNKELKRNDSVIPTLSLFTREIQPEILSILSEDFITFSCKFGGGILGRLRLFTVHEFVNSQDLRFQTLRLRNHCGMPEDYVVFGQDIEWNAIYYAFYKKKIYAVYDSSIGHEINDLSEEEVKIAVQPSDDSLSSGDEDDRNKVSVAVKCGGNGKLLNSNTIASKMKVPPKQIEVEDFNDFIEQYAFLFTSNKNEEIGDLIEYFTGNENVNHQIQPNTKEEEEGMCNFFIPFPEL